MASKHSIIIAEGGTSGCVLSSCLTEDPNINVLVLELGQDQCEHQLVPVLAAGPQIWEGPDVTTFYKTATQENFNGRSIRIPQGKGLGGSSLINYGVVAFPDRHSIDNIGLLGNEGWSFESLLPYYRKFHTFNEPDNEVIEKLSLDYNTPALHGKSGPVQVSFGTYQSDVNLTWGKTLDRLNRKVRFDPQSGDALGGYNAPGSLNPSGWRRSHAAEAYLTPDKILFKEPATDQNAHRIAEGIQYVAKDGTRQIARADEIILCGGTFGSPQLLELSGVGSKEILDQFSIKVQVELPGVGTNLQDHTVSGACWQSRIPTMDTMLRDPAIAGAYFEEYQKHQTGPMADGTFSIGFLGDESSAAEKQQLRSLLNEFAPCTDASSGYRKQYELLRKAAEDPKRGSSGYILFAVQGTPKQISPIPPEAKDEDFVSMWAIVSHPFSRGTSHINSSDVHDPPKIDPHYMSHPADAHMTARRLQYAQTIVKTEPLASLIRPNGTTIPPKLDEILGDIDRAQEHVRTDNTCYHPVGTCAMMRREDGGVVDAEFRVHGIQGLRVVDASVLPLIPRGNIQTTVYAVAERAADMIKEDLRSG